MHEFSSQNLQKTQANQLISGKLYSLPVVLVLLFHVYKYLILYIFFAICQHCIMQGLPYACPTTVLLASGHACLNSFCCVHGMNHAHQLAWDRLGVTRN